ncbi:MAG: hypothetical protein CL663_00445 [Bacteroidetes bacterium]|nr:hypothetical protein [Bacteroidota bacterium]
MRNFLNGLVIYKRDLKK